MNNTRRRQIKKDIKNLENQVIVLEYLKQKYCNTETIPSDDLTTLIEKLESVSSILEDVSFSIDDLANEERECYDNLPESIQWSEKGEAMEAAADNLEMAKDAVDSATESVNDIVTELNDIDEVDNDIDIDFDDVIVSIDECVDYLNDAME